MTSDKLEKSRLDALISLDILDTGPEPAFDNLTALASQIFGVPTALISLADAHRHWFKSCIGLSLNSTPRDVAFCSHALACDDVIIVPDASLDPRFCDNPMVTGEPFIRFYAGAPIRYQGRPIGTLCIIDPEPRPVFTASDAKSLQRLADSVSSVLTMRKDALINLALLKQHEAARHTLSLVEDVAGIGQWSYDVASGKISWSDQIFRIHGLPVTTDAPAYEELLALFDPADASRLSQLVSKALQTGDGYRLEAKIRTPGGIVRDVVAKAVSLRDDEGKITALTGVLQDVTEYRHVIARLEASEAGYRLLAENVPGMVGYWSASLRCKFANNAYLEWFGRTPGSLVGEHMEALLGPDIFALNKPHIDAVLAGQEQIFERAIIRPSGEVGHILTHYVPDLGENGLAVGFYVLATDITDLKLKELALSESNAQLIEARQKAEAAMEIKSQFLATMSHEIRTPLTTILGYANFLSETEGLSDEAISFAQRIVKAGGTLLGLVNDVLDLSRLESGQMALNPRATSLRNIGRDLAEQFQLAASARNLALSVNIDRELPALILLDAQRLNQVLTNLVGNACKFASGGTIDVLFSAVEFDAQPALRVEVSDDGPGLDKDVISVLFQRFQQGDSGANRRHGGSGLGLAICAELIDLMKGRIGVESTPGIGSTFWFEVPLIMALPASPAPDHTTGDRSTVPFRVLLVDDHAVNRQLIRTLIVHCDGEVEEATNGAEALKKCRDTRFDLIFMDIQMPDMDGIAATRAIRALCTANVDTPIIALTALSKAQLPVDASGALFSNHLSKPIDPKKFQEILFRAARYDQVHSAEVTRT